MQPEIFSVSPFIEWGGAYFIIWYYELLLPEGLKKFSKGSPIQDEHFAEARALYEVLDAYREGASSRAPTSDRSWIVPVEEIKARGYDLTARNPNRPVGATYASPVEVVADPMEKERQILGILAESEAIVGVNHSSPAHTDNREEAR